MKTLGLGETATFQEIKAAYRKLAQQLHPDKNRGDDASRHRFVEVSRAYRMLVGATRAVERGKLAGLCVDCGDFGEVSIGTDGHPRCVRCVFRPAGGRLLPFPVLVVAKCLGTICLLAVGTWLLLVAVSTGRQMYAVIAFVSGLLGLAVLAHTCVSVLHCLQPGERIRYRRQRSSTKS